MSGLTESRSQGRNDNFFTRFFPSRSGACLRQAARNACRDLPSPAAGIGDILTGLIAVPVAISLGSGSRESRRAAIAWNIFGLLDFAIALPIGTAITLRLIETGVASVTGGLYPAVMIPAFGVPTWIILHALSLRQLSRRNRAATR
jgi:hypothetical protein